MSTLTMERRVTGEGREILVPPSTVGEMEVGALTPPKSADVVIERPEEAGPYCVALCCTFEARTGDASHPRAPAVTRALVR